MIFWFIPGATKFFNRRRYRYYGNDNHVYIEKNGKRTEVGFFQLPFHMEVKFTRGGSNTLIFNMDNTSKPLRKFFSRDCKIRLSGGSTVRMELPAKHIRHDFRVEACDKSLISIGKNLAVFGDLYVTASGYKGARIIIGDDCLFSKGISIRNEDGHTIIDNDTQECISLPKDTIIGNHVWIGWHVTILKGSVIGDNSVVGACSLVNKAFPESNVIIAGMPAKIIKRNINWDVSSVAAYETQRKLIEQT